MSSSTRTLTGVPFGFLSLNYNTFNEIRCRTIRLENKLDYYIYNYYWMCANVVLEKICGCFSFFYCFVLWFNLFEHFEFINRLKEENALNALFNFLFFVVFMGVTDAYAHFQIHLHVIYFISTESNSILPHIKLIRSLRSRTTSYYLSFL